jgi:hypothetical protein
MSQEKCYLSLLSMMFIGTLLPGCAIAVDSVVAVKPSDCVTNAVVDNGAITILPGNAVQNIPVGYHNGAGTVAGDSNLLSGNIKRDITIFGVTGDSDVINSSSGDAVNTEILLGKKAWVDGEEVTGSMAPQTLSENTTTVDTGFYIETSLETVENDLKPANIKTGVNIFGIEGTYTGIGGNIHDTSSGTATSDDILTGKVVWVAGVEVTGEVPEGGNISGANGKRSFLIPDGLYSGNDKTATANDSYLIPGNIKAGITIFDVTGTYASAEVVKTGQTRCSYNDGSVWKWDEDCAKNSRPPGQDAEVKPGTDWPNPRFSANNNDGTVTDNLTGLVWLANASCTKFYSGDSSDTNIRNWSDALLAVNLLGNGNCNLSDGSSAGDWRLPSIKEMQSLVDFMYADPAFSNDAGTGQWTAGADSAFSGVQSDDYWSSTNYAGKVGFSWFVFLKYGVVYNASKSVTLHVWPVRD